MKMKLAIILLAVCGLAMATPPVDFVTVKPIPGVPPMAPEGK